MVDSVRPGLLAFAVAERCQGLCGVDLVMHGWRWATTSPREARRPSMGSGLSSRRPSKGSGLRPGAPHGVRVERDNDLSEVRGRACFASCLGWLALFRTGCRRS